MDLQSRLEQLTSLASIDEANSYEVDETHILFDPVTKKFVLITASGCSCWDGDYEESQYDSINGIAAALESDGDRQYNPSILGARQLIAQAKEAAKLILS